MRARATLERVARTLGDRPARGKLPALVLFTDPQRTPDPVAAASRMPRGSMVVYRAFGAADAVERGRALKRVARRRRLVLLVGGDERLARAVAANGVHLPERLVVLAPALRRKGWTVTVAAHTQKAMRRAARCRADAVFVSPVFPSRSGSAGRPLGVIRFGKLASSVPGPVYALGGVNAKTASRLARTKAAGFAAVDGLA